MHQMRVFEIVVHPTSFFASLKLCGGLARCCQSSLSMIPCIGLWQSMPVYTPLLPRGVEAVQRLSQLSLEPPIVYTRKTLTGPIAWLVACRGLW